MPHQGVVAFTTCSSDGVEHVLTLYETFSHHHPEIPFYCLLTADEGDVDWPSLPFAIVPISDVGVPGVNGLATRCDPELFRALTRPFVFQFLFDLHPGSAVLYLDSDVIVTSRFDEVLELLADGAECVLAPVITEPAEYGNPQGPWVLDQGAFDQGFCCVADRPAVRRVVWWWARRMVASIDQGGGSMPAQRWMDFLPAFIEQTRILRHPGYGLASWNLSQRTLSRTDRTWSVNARPLRFFHACGGLEDGVAVRQASRLELRNLGLLGNLLTAYQGIGASPGRGGRDCTSERLPASWAAGRHQPVAGAEGHPAAAVPYLSVMAWWNRHDYERWAEMSRGVLAERRSAEMEDIGRGDTFALPGYCIVCAELQSFVTGSSHSDHVLEDGRPVPNWREHLVCRGCGFNNRQRASYHLLLQEVRPLLASRIYLTEFVTGYPSLLKREFPLTTGSEYLGPEHGPGQLVDGVPHEDLQALSFEDGSLDVILSFDVLEHVPDERKAFSEMARCLRSGGKLLMTAPTRIDYDDNAIRAVMSESGEVVHIMEPEYHGNPIDPAAGSLCYRYFGWHILSQLKEAGFQDAQLLTYWSRQFRYYGDPQLAILAVR